MAVAGALDLPTLIQKVRLDADTAGAEKKVQGGLNRIGGAMTNVGKKATLGLTLPIVAFGVAGVKSASQVETGLREVNTLFGLTGKAAEQNFGELQGLVQGLSNDVGIAQDVLTKGLYNAISAGVPKDNAFEFMKIASEASVAGVTDVNTAVDGLTSVINAFGLDMSDAEKVSDSMFAAVQGGKTTFEELSASIFNIAPAAAASKVSMEEVNAAIATLTASGTPTSVATTQLRAALTGLQRPSEKLDKAFQAVGFESAQMALEQKGLAFALDVVKDASAGNNGALTEMLGSVEAVAAANVIAGTSAEKMAAEMDRQANAAGATSTAFDEMEKSNSRKMERLKVTFQNLSIAIGNALLPIVGAIGDKLQGVLDAFTKLSPGMQKVAGAALAIVAAAGPMLIIFGKLLQSFSAIKAAIGGASLLGMGPLLPVVLALGAAGFVVWKNWDKVRPTFEKIVEVVKTAASVFVSAFQDPDITSTGWIGTIEKIASITRGVFDELARGWKTLTTGFTEDDAATPLEKIALVIRNDVLPIVSAVVDFLGRHWKPIVIGAFIALAGPVTATIALFVVLYKRFEVVRRVVGAVARFLVRTVAPAVVSFAKTVGQWIGNVVDYFREIAPDVKEAMGHVLVVLKAVFDVIREVIQVALGVLAAIWRAWGDDIWNIVKALWKTIEEVIRGALGIVKGIIKTVLAVINGDWGKAWDGIKQIVDGVWDAIFGIVRGAKNILESIFGGIASTISEVWRGLWDGIKDAASAAWRFIAEKVINPLLEGINTVIEGVNKITVVGPDIPKISLIEVARERPTRTEFHVGGNIVARQGGGSIDAGQFGFTGEGGPELEFRRHPSAILSASRLEGLMRQLVEAGPASGGAGDVIHATIETVDRPTGEQLGRDMAWGLSQARHRPRAGAGRGRD